MSRHEGDEATWSEERDGIRIDWQVPVAMPDGVILRPVDAGR